MLLNFFFLKTINACATWLSVAPTSASRSISKRKIEYRLGSETECYSTVPHSIIKFITLCSKHPNHIVSYFTEPIADNKWLIPVVQYCWGDCVKCKSLSLWRDNAFKKKIMHQLSLNIVCQRKVISKVMSKNPERVFISFFRQTL